MENCILLNCTDPKNEPFIVALYFQIILAQKLAFLLSTKEYSVTIGGLSVMVKPAQDLFFFDKNKEAKYQYLMVTSFSSGESGTFGSVSVIEGSWKIHVPDQRAEFKVKAADRVRMVKIHRPKIAPKIRRDVIDSYHNEHQVGQDVPYMGYKYPPARIGGSIINLMRRQPGECLVDRLDRIYTIPHYLSLIERLRISIAILKELRYLHELKLIHGDLKPDNIIIGENAKVAIVDFGHAKKAAEVTKGYIVGTPDYIDPRLIDGSASQVDLASDVYSILLTLALGFGDVSRTMLECKPQDENYLRCLYNQKQDYPLTELLDEIPHCYQDVKTRLFNLFKKGLSPRLEERSPWNDLDCVLASFIEILKDAKKIRRELARKAINAVKNNEDLTRFSAEEAYAFLHSLYVTRCLKKGLHLEAIQTMVHTAETAIIKLPPNKRKQLSDCKICPDSGLLAYMVSLGYTHEDIESLIECGVPVTSSDLNTCILHFTKNRIWNRKSLKVVQMMYRHCQDKDAFKPSELYFMEYNLLIGYFLRGNTGSYSDNTVLHLINQSVSIMVSSGLFNLLKSITSNRPDPQNTTWGLVVNHLERLLSEFCYSQLFYADSQLEMTKIMLSALAYFFESHQRFNSINEEADIPQTPDTVALIRARWQILNRIISSINEIISERDYEQWKSKLLDFYKQEKLHSKFIRIDSKCKTSLCVKNLDNLELKPYLDPAQIQRYVKYYSKLIQPSASTFGIFGIGASSPGVVDKASEMPLNHKDVVCKY